MRKSKSWVNTLSLIDIPLCGRRYTWKRGGSKSKLDRFLYSADWMVKFPFLQSFWQYLTLFDHIPLFFSLFGSINWDVKPFKCLDVWLNSYSFGNLVNEECRKMDRIHVHHKLKMLKLTIKRWNDFVFGNVDQNEKELQKLDLVLDNRDLSVIEEAKMATLKLELHKWKMRKAQILRQYSRKRKLREKDNHNTSKFFHACASLREKQNTVNNLKIGESILSSVAKIKAGIREFF